MSAEPASWKELLANPGPDGHIVQLYQDVDFYGEAISRSPRDIRAGPRVRQASRAWRQLDPGSDRCGPRHEEFLMVIRSLPQGNRAFDLQRNANRAPIPKYQMHPQSSGA